MTEQPVTPAPAPAPAHEGDEPDVMTRELVESVHDVEVDPPAPER